MFATAVPDRLLSLLACPACHGRLEVVESSLRCDACAECYPVRDGVPMLLTAASRVRLNATRSNQENIALRRRLGRHPMLLRIAEWLRPPHPFLFTTGRRNRARFSELVLASGGAVPAVVDIGAGVRGGRGVRGLDPTVRAATLGLEVAPAPGAAIVGDAHVLPIRDSALDGVLIQGVLEHVRDPECIVREIRRVVKPGAPVYAEVPFLQHYHLDPEDFRRYTVDGLRQLFGTFTVLDAGVAAGPSSALCDLLTEYCAVPFRSPLLYWGVKWVTGWAFTPVRWLDLLMARAPRADHIAGGVYFLGLRPVTDAR